MTEELTHEVLFLPRCNDQEGFVDVKVHPLDRKPVLPCDETNIGHYFYSVCPSFIVTQYLKDVYDATGPHMLAFEQYRLQVEQVNADQSDVYTEKKNDAIKMMGSIKKPISEQGIAQAIRLCQEPDTHKYIKMKAQHYLKDASDEFFRFYKHNPESAPGLYCLKKATELSNIAK
ncbi:MAG: hypothetical protein JRE40_00275 [Deltaproteobacteria bacterium]|nr:hypothetical protein [Deltaproteobacteria bacterium]